MWYGADDLVGHGDVKAYTLDEIRTFCGNAGLKLKSWKQRRSSGCIW